MANFEPTLTLSVDNLDERRNQLQTELNKVIHEQVTTGLKESLKLNLKDSDVNITRLSWDFYPESDDEGGSVWYTSDLSAQDENGEYIELEEIKVEQLSWNKEYTYESDLRDILSEILHDYSRDLYDQYITEIEL